MQIIKEINMLSGLEIGEAQFPIEAAVAPEAKAEAKKNVDNQPLNSEPAALQGDEQHEIDTDEPLAQPDGEVGEPTNQPEAEEKEAVHPYISGSDDPLEDDQRQVEIEETGTQPEADVEETQAQPEPEANIPRSRTVKIVPNLDEDGAAERVLESCWERIRFLTDRRQMYAHDGARYGDFPHLAEKMAQVALNRVHEEYEKGRIHMDKDGNLLEKKDIFKFQTKVRSGATRDRALNSARLDPRIQVKANDFDANDNEINTLNGLLNLDTGILSPHAPSQLVTKLAPVRWDPNATCPDWERSIDAITIGDVDYAKFLQRLCGYYLSGSTKEQVLPMLAGRGGNGKTFLQNAMLEIIGSGEYGITLTPKVIFGKGVYGETYFICQLDGKRAVFLSETEEGGTFNGSIMKSITGGDVQSARAIGKNPIQFKSKAKIILAVNHLPVLINPQEAERRRLLVLPFNKKFDRKVEQDELERQVQAEKEGIFAWMVRGYQDWSKQKLNPPKVVLDATAAYFSDNDQIGNFLSERTVIAPNAFTTQKAIFDDYCQWAHETGTPALGMHKLSELLEASMQERQFEKGRKNKARGWKGIALKRIV